MKRIFIIVAILAIGAALGGLVAQVSPTARTLLAWTALPRFKEKTSTRAEPTLAKDASTPSKSKDETEKAPEGSINMPPEQIAAQEIEVALVEKGVLARVLAVPGTITLDPGRVARVPGRVEGTVTQMRKRLGDLVSPGEVVAVLDSREVADAKSEYLTAQVALDLQRTMFERQQILWAQKSTAELQHVAIKIFGEEFEPMLRVANQIASVLRSANGTPIVAKTTSSMGTSSL